MKTRAKNNFGGIIGGIRLHRLPFTGSPTRIRTSNLLINSQRNHIISATASCEAVAFILPESCSTRNFALP